MQAIGNGIKVQLVLLTLLLVSIVCEIQLWQTPACFSFCFVGYLTVVLFILCLQITAEGFKFLVMYKYGILVVLDHPVEWSYLYFGVYSDGVTDYIMRQSLYHEPYLLPQLMLLKGKKVCPLQKIYFWEISDFLVRVAVTAGAVMPLFLAGYIIGLAYL